MLMHYVHTHSLVLLISPVAMLIAAGTLAANFLANPVAWQAWQKWIFAVVALATVAVLALVWFGSR